MRYRPVACVSAVALALAAASPSAAAITLYNSPGVVQPAENVLMNTGSVGTTVFGTTNNSGTRVSFVSLVGGVSLTDPSNGQARIEAVGGPLDSLRFFLTNGQGFSEVEFDLHKAASDTSSVTVTFFGSFAGGQTAKSFALGNGNNWFSAETSDGDLITSVMFDTEGAGVDDLRHVRIGGRFRHRRPVAAIA
jgi:hypothetical protein